MCIEFQTMLINACGKYTTCEHMLGLSFRFFLQDLVYKLQNFIFKWHCLHAKNSFCFGGFNSLMSYMINHLFAWLRFNITLKAIDTFKGFFIIALYFFCCKKKVFSNRSLLKMGRMFPLQLACFRIHCRLLCPI